MLVNFVLWGFGATTGVTGIDRRVKTELETVVVSALQKPRARQRVSGSCNDKLLGHLYGFRFDRKPIIASDKLYFQVTFLIVNSSYIVLNCIVDYVQYC